MFGMLPFERSDDNLFDTFEKIVKFLERRFTGWQETIQQ